MSGAVQPGTSKAQAEPLGLPVGFKVGSAFPFAGLNVSDSRLAIADQEFSWLENYLRVGKGRLRVAYDVGPPIYTTTGGRSIVRFFWFNIGDQDSLCIVFLDDGTAVQVDMSGLIKQVSSTPGRFYRVGGNLPATCPWGSQYLLISNNNTPNDYWVWDGSILYAAGTVSPTINLTSGGSGYTSPPLVTAFGGSGSGATFAASVVNGSVVSVVPVTTGSGYGPADVVQLAFSGGGTDSGAILQAVLSGGSVSNLILTSGGVGYTTPPTVTLTGGGGTGATAIATLGATSLGPITVSAGGTGYTSAPTILVLGGGGSGATAVATVGGGAVTSITVTNAGSGYTFAPTIQITGGSGTGAAASAVLIAAPVASLIITNAGTGYTGTPTVAIAGTGTGASGVAILSSGSVTSVTVVNGGTDFTGTPLVTFQGGGGSGAQATAVITAGTITSVDVTNGGTDYTAPPAVGVQSGINNAASATVDMMPLGISGAAIETYQSRAWLTHPYQAGTLPAGGSINLSAPASFVDFATSDGGLLFQNSDRFLRAKYTTLRQSNGYLYTLGDSSVSVINNVQTSGNPTTTTFNALNVDPQTGSTWRDTCADYARTILFANPFGVFGIYGGSVTKVSKKLDPIFDNALFPPTAGALTPSTAVANLFSQRTFLMLMTITDPFTLLARNVMIGWDENDWSVFSQSASLTYIGSREQNSDIEAWGTDGRSLLPLFAGASATLEKTLQTKYWASESGYLVEGSYGIYVIAQNRMRSETSLSFTTTVDSIGVVSPLDLPDFMADEVPAGGASTPMVENPVAFEAPAGRAVCFGTSTQPVVGGAGIGLTMRTMAPDFEFLNLQLGYIDVHGIA